MITSFAAEPEELLSPGFRGRPCIGRLTGTSAQVWQIPLRAPDRVLERMHALLAPDEQRRMTRLRFSHHRARFLLARGALRLLLGAYLDMPADQLVFRYARHGKPGLSGGPDPQGLEFNLSHSHELCACAFSRARPLGIDIEYRYRSVNVAGLSRRLFSATEIAELERTPPALRTHAFLNGWTRKEAVLKATGEGLTGSLRRVGVSLAPDKPARFQAPGPAGWRLEALELGSDYVGALALAPPHRDGPRDALDINRDCAGLGAWAVPQP
ncbi:MAG: hypothetical protein B7Z66_08160 [Chromatiales bacterium 21-64-14]|nr:MAG: hypothetical protein B7Z66_08160 [Chromatiales bacterium 21-64-14]HQU15310.1 4'-phosphopantetheinyl transferase superfamily protein [Gammaproteobacteria bacterium]